MKTINIRKGKPAKAISPIALEAVKRIDALFAIEREINGHDPAARLTVRQRQSAPLVEDLVSLPGVVKGKLLTCET